jgi:hypothetical protein
MTEELHRQFSARRSVKEMFSAPIWDLLAPIRQMDHQWNAQAW